VFATLKQIRSLLAVGLQTLPQRKSTSGVVIVGIAGVVGVLVSALAISAGIERTLQGSGREDTVLLLSAGSDGETGSTVSHDEFATIADVPGVARTGDGKALVSPEIVTVFPVKFRKSGSPANVSLRGIGVEGFAIHPTVRITAGRTFRPGLREIIAGAGVARQFQGFAIGDRVAVGSTVWTVTGHFESGDVHDSEVLADVDTVQSALDMGGHYNSIYARLQSADMLPTFKDHIAHNPTLHLDAQSEAHYFLAQSQDLSAGLTVAAYVIGVIMALGALFGAVHSLYISTDIRMLEMAILRAIGFGAVSVMLAFLLEALLLAVAGGCIGGASAWLLFNGYTASTINGINGGLSQVVFQLHVSMPLIVQGVIWACVIGLLGALAPGIRAARLQVAEALRR
jgi:putative ABC transport system permease protein